MKKPKLDIDNISEEFIETPIVEEESKKQPSATEKTPEDTITELTNDLQRTRADFENFRKQAEAQKSQAMVSAKTATVAQFLPLLDDFDRAFETYPDQLAPLKKSLTKTLNSLKLTKVISSPGTEFNPDVHEAISVEDDDGDIEVIAETLRPGYFYDENLIRAAMVRVKHADSTK